MVVMVIENRQYFATHGELRIEIIHILSWVSFIIKGDFEYIFGAC